MKKHMFHLLAAGAASLIVIVSFSFYSPLGRPVFTQGVVKQASPQILIDAGHGGMDGGTVSADGTKESGLNLDISFKLRDFASIMGFSVKMTRESDISIHDASAKTVRAQKVSDIHNRLNMLEKGDCELLISVHQNQFSESKYRGTQVFYSANNEKSKPMAEAIQQSVREKIQPENSRQIKRCPKTIYLLYHATKPAVLVECGFLSNSAETELLKSNVYQNKLCFAVLSGVLNNYGT